MDAIDAEIAVGLLNDYWPRTLNDEQCRVWARALARTEAGFELTCQTIADMAAERSRPPTLAELVAAVKPAGSPTPIERLIAPEDVPTDSGPPAPLDRGRQWAAHVANLGRNAAQRRELHDHRHGWERCPVCSMPGDHRRCHSPLCFCSR